MKERQKSLDRALEEAVSRALRDNLAPLQRTADELHQAYADLVAACSSTRPSNALPAMLRAQTAASSLAAGLSVLSNFVAVALKPRDSSAAAEAEDLAEAASSVAQARARSSPAAVAEPEEEAASEPVQEAPAEPAHVEHVAQAEAPATEQSEHSAQAAQAEVMAEQAAVVESQAFNVASLPPEIQDLHRRANRVAKVAMQDIKLLRPKDVKAAREHKDICIRLRSDLDKARKEYDRRFRAILEQPVDYFHHWMVEILAEGDTEALGEYPYPSPVLRH
jgi:chemotaxis protein histidine kinase CheA